MVTPNKAADRDAKRNASNGRCRGAKPLVF